MKTLITTLLFIAPALCNAQANIFLQAGPVLAKGYNGVSAGIGIKTSSSTEKPFGMQFAVNYLNLSYKSGYFKYNANFVSIDALAAVTTMKEKDLNIHIAGGLSLLMNVGKVKIAGNNYVAASSAFMPKLEAGIGFSRVIFKAGMYVDVNKSLDVPLFVPEVAIYPFFKRKSTQQKEP